MTSDFSGKKKPTAAEADADTPRIGATIQRGWIDEHGNSVPEGAPEPAPFHSITPEEFYRGLKPDPAPKDPDYPVPGLRTGGRLKSWQRALRQHSRTAIAPAATTKPRPSW